MKSKQDLKSFFENGDKPNQEQFWALIESYFHKDEPISLEELSMLKANLATIDKTSNGTETIGNVDTKEQVNTKINAAINALKANAPETYDTLKEIADYIANDSNAEAALLQLISTKLDKPTMTNNYYGLWDDTNKKFVDGNLVKHTDGTTYIHGYYPNTSLAKVKILDVLPLNVGTNIYQSNYPSSIYAGDIIAFKNYLWLQSNGVNGFVKKLGGLQVDGTSLNFNTFRTTNRGYGSSVLWTTGNADTSVTPITGGDSRMKAGAIFSVGLQGDNSQGYNLGMESVELMFDVYGQIFTRGVNPNNYFWIQSDWKKAVMERIGYTTSLSEKLDATKGINTKDLSFTLQTNITPTPNTLVPKIDGSRPIWHNNSSIAKDVALLEDINSTNITNAINSATSAQKTTMRTALFGSSTPASPVLNGISRSFIAQGEQNVLIDLFGLNLTLLDPTLVYIVNPNDGSFLYAKSFANKTTTVVTTVWDIPQDFPIGNYPIKIQIVSVPQGISSANINIVSSYTTTDINQSSWKRKIRMKPDNSGEYTFLDTNTQYGLNYLQYQDTVSLITGDVMKDSAGFDVVGGFGAITNSELLANKDWEVTINIKYLNYGGASTPYGYLVGVTSTTHSSFNLLTDLVKTASFLGRPNSIGGFETGVAEKTIPSGGTVTVVISKVGNIIFMRYIYFDGTNYTYQYKTVTGIDTQIPYSIFITEPVGIWSSSTYYQIKQAFFNIKIMN